MKITIANEATVSPQMDDPMLFLNAVTSFLQAALFSTSTVNPPDVADPQPSTGSQSAPQDGAAAGQQTADEDAGDANAPATSPPEAKGPLSERGQDFLINGISGRCIDAKGAPAVNRGAVLHLWDCELSGYGPGNSATDQRWEMLSGGFIRNKLSGLCIDVKGAPAVHNGAELQLWDCELSGYGPNNSPTDQRWEILPEGFIRNILSGKCIDAKGAPAVHNGAELQLWDCELSGGPNASATDQQWHWGS